MTRDRRLNRPAEEAQDTVGPHVRPTRQLCPQAPERPHRRQKPPAETKTLGHEAQPRRPGHRPRPPAGGPTGRDYMSPGGSVWTVGTWSLGRASPPEVFKDVARPSAERESVCEACRPGTQGQGTLFRFLFSRTGQALYYGLGIESSLDQGSPPPVVFTGGISCPGRLTFQISVFNTIVFLWKSGKWRPRTRDRGEKRS